MRNKLFARADLSQPSAEAQPSCIRKTFCLACHLIWASDRERKSGGGLLSLPADRVLLSRGISRLEPTRAACAPPTNRQSFASNRPPGTGQTTTTYTASTFYVSSSPSTDFIWSHYISRTLQAFLTFTFSTSPSIWLPWKPHLLARPGQPLHLGPRERHSPLISRPCLL